jgi:hypothetical protein
MDYVQITARQRTEMLRFVGAAGIDDLLRPLFGNAPRPAPMPLDLPAAPTKRSISARCLAVIWT